MFIRNVMLLSLYTSEVLGASEVSANLYCNSHLYWEGFRDYLRLLMGRTLAYQIEIYFFVCDIKI